MIESYYHRVPVAKIATYLKHTRTIINNVIKFFKAGHTAFEDPCGTKKIRTSMDGKNCFTKRITALYQRENN